MKFWIYEPYIRDLLLGEGYSLVESDITDAEYAVILGNFGINFAHEVITEGEGYRLVKVVR